MTEKNSFADCLMLVGSCMVIVGITMLLICFIIMVVTCNQRDGFKPSKEEQEKRANDLIKHLPNIKDGLTDAKKVMPWIDPITYEDARKLLRQNQYNKESLIRILD